MRWKMPALAIVALSAAVTAGAQTLQTVSVSGMWIRFITPTTPAAGYFTVTNAGARPVVITGASSPDCGQLMLHQSRNVNGTEHMEMVSSVTVPAHGSVKFAPGGYHLMCMSPSANIAPGRTVPITLTFADKRSITKPFIVRGAKGQ
jgi:periplasmic copper chaperone A